MYDCFIVARSITSAQRLSRILTDVGFRAMVEKLPFGLEGAGCGYVVKTPENKINEVLKYLKSMEYGPVRAFCEFENDQVEEYQ